MQKKLTSNEIQLSAALAGDNALDTRGESQEFEQALLNKDPDLMALIQENRMRHERRSITLYLQNLSWVWQNDTTLALSFSLPKGSFATSILRELVESVAHQ